MTENKKRLGLFDAYGIELEYMIVDKDTLNILPVTDVVIHEVAKEYVNEVKVGDMEWSNELTLHVIELKTSRPASSLNGLGKHFHEHILKINEILENRNGELMPTSMHPWMDPFTEMKLWPHDNSPIYDAYNKIFDCRGHGWANLQSMHINLPFDGDDQFGRLHAAIRLVLPFLPALAASSPVSECRVNDYLDYRLEVYRHNQSKVPSIVGHIIPEPVFTAADYDKVILQKIYKEIKPLDPEGVLQEEWLNSRGAIARFDRNAIEIRLLDIQECPDADIAIAAFVCAVIKGLVEEKWMSYEEQKNFSENELFMILMDCVRRGETTEIINRNYLKVFGCDKERCMVNDLLKHMLDELPEIKNNNEFAGPINTILSEGTLATRILKAIGYKASKENLTMVYNKLCKCLVENKSFHV